MFVKIPSGRSGNQLVTLNITQIESFVKPSEHEQLAITMASGQVIRTTMTERELVLYLQRNKARVVDLTETPSAPAETSSETPAPPAE